jgi:CheY-like chemotaxis protein
MDKAKILIVEDEKSIAKIMKLMLSQNGYSVCDVVANGEEAVDIALRTRPDLILMDIKLQGSIDGIMACDEIKKLANIPLIYVTAYADQDTYAKAMATYPSAFIVKPFRGKELIEEIELALSSINN